MKKYMCCLLPRVSMPDLLQVFWCFFGLTEAGHVSAMCGMDAEARSEAVSSWPTRCPFFRWLQTNNPPRLSWSRWVSPVCCRMSSKAWSWVNLRLARIEIYSRKGKGIKLSRSNKKMLPNMFSDGPCLMPNHSPVRRPASDGLAVPRPCNPGRAQVMIKPCSVCLGQAISGLLQAISNCEKGNGWDELVISGRC